MLTFTRHDARCRCRIPGEGEVAFKCLCNGRQNSFTRVNSFYARQALHVVDTFSMFIGWLLPLVDPKKQTFADKIARTVVVKV